MTCAPVVVFAYARHDHLARTLRSLQADPLAAETPLHVYCDAARSPSHQAGVHAVRRIVDGIAGFASVTRVYRERNMGLAHSVIDGVGEVLRTHGRVIVLEDDLLLSPHFLRYMNDGLDCYAADESVASVHGYSYPVDGSLPETYFLRGADCWGWATWQRAWQHFEPDGQRLLDELRRRRLQRAFDLDGSYPFTRMLEDQIAGRNDSWAVRWHASAFLRDMLTLYPGRSLVHNIGNDNSGTHSRGSGDFDVQLATTPVPVERLQLAPSAPALALIAGYFRRQRRLHRRLLRGFGRWMDRRTGWGR